MVPQSEAGNKGKMVAEATLVTEAVVGATGLEAAILLIRFQEEGSIVDVTSVKGCGEGGTGKDVVKTGPQALKAVGGTGTMMACGRTGNMIQMMRFKILQGGITLIIVEVTGNEDLSIR